MPDEQAKQPIRVHISPENMAALRAAAAARGETLVWYVLSRLGCKPAEGQYGRRRVATPGTPSLYLSRERQPLPVTFTEEERNHLQQRAAAGRQTLSAYVHAKLGIEARERGRPGHR